MHDMVHVSRHPIVLDKVTRLRDKNTESKVFRELVADLSHLLFIEASHDLKLAEHIVETPLAECQGHVLCESIGLFPILRAGLGMADAILNFVPTAQVWHLGLYRDHVTHQPVTYYNKMPEKTELDVAIVLDPMLATGGSAAMAVEGLAERGARQVRLLSIVAAPEGIAHLRAVAPGATVYTAAIDRQLDGRKFILPGLGDFGDRLFGT
jgi:uracil phosphoribosyltransferase